MGHAIAAQDSARPAPGPMWRLLVAAAVALASASSAPARDIAPDSCTIVFGQGRNVDEGPLAGTNSWDEVNRTFASQVALDLAGAGTRTLRVLLPAASADLQAIVASLLDQAESQGCSRIVETTLFADDETDLIVARLRAYPVLRDGRSTRIGEPLYTHQQEVPNTRRNRDRLVPAALGAEFAAEYLRQSPVQPRSASPLPAHRSPP